MNSIVSKNNLADIETLLRDRGLWDYFIFPSIDWTPKGPRIAATLDAIGLRGASTLFIDDNPMNLAQAVDANPGLNVALPDVIAHLRDAPQLRGKPDAEFSRLAQYKVKERKADAAQATAGDVTEFLRTSDVKVFLEYDVEAHLDRAIELVNRTNQLNFTKNRLPEDIDDARAQLRTRLAHNTTDAALIRVQDKFGDYGFVGFYLTRRINNARGLDHFCFSCRTLNMYIEHWVYEFLGRPALTITGEVLSDPTATSTSVDWITPANIEDMDSPQNDAGLHVDTIYARGGCDLASLMHYFTLHTDTTIEEFNEPRDGQMFRRDHSAFLMPALADDPLGEDQYAAAASLGYGPHSFDSALPDLVQGGARTLYFFSFWADADIPVYRHTASGVQLPYWLVGGQNHDLIARQDLRDTLPKTDQQKTRLDVLATQFTHDGLLDQAAMEQRYRAVLDYLPRDAQVVWMLANERGPASFQPAKKGLFGAKPAPKHPWHVRHNAAVRAATAERANVALVDPADFITSGDDLIDLNHFKRGIYHKMYRAILDRLG